MYIMNLRTQLKSPSNGCLTQRLINQITFEADHSFYHFAGVNLEKSTEIIRLLIRCNK